MPTKAELEQQMEDVSSFVNTLASHFGVEPMREGERYVEFAARIGEAANPAVNAGSAEAGLSPDATIRHHINRTIHKIETVMQAEGKRPGNLLAITNELRQGLNDAEGHPLLDK